MGKQNFKSTNNWQIFQRVHKGTTIQLIIGCYNVLTDTTRKHSYIITAILQTTFLNNIGSAAFVILSSNRQPRFTQIFP